MRVHTYHEHTICHSSVLLGGLLHAHLGYSILFTTPIWCAHLGRRWRKTEKGSSRKGWFLFLLLLWWLVEVPRLYLGLHANPRMLVGKLGGFLFLSVVPQVVVFCLYISLFPHVNDLELSICVVQLILLSLEIITAFRLLIRLMRYNTVDYYIHFWNPSYY
ncbi:unnamed protein product [Phytomonas sp. EM1]|nr:unnamed protein product [Phytomonas sp. EM1]|eukprot:CCW63877.1 unnamed protein product [Phytomonas sp. isolate EM1]